MNTEYTLTASGSGFTEIAVLEAAAPSAAPFNRYRFLYTASEPLRGKIYYRDHENNPASEAFYLEAAETKTAFSSFTDAYLTGKLASEVEKIELSGTSGSAYGVTITSFTTEAAEILTETTVYIENEYMRVGALLSYGGGLSYIKWKKDSPSGMDNLLNRYDPGRLVQQSYYGTSQPPYECATFMGHRWSYNPVQGGDQHNNISKLIDYRITETSMYVKCRPLDWAQNNLPTYSYMENTYSLDGKLLRVDNRFVDFSPYTHGRSSQELPAFYTISALKKFTYYVGTAPWTYDKLTSRDDMIFWAEPGADHIVEIADGNTETWCAFTDDDPETNDFGLGLYVPNISRYTAGRFMYNGSTDPMNPATNYVAPLRTMTLQAFKPIEYGYLITGGPLTDIRKSFTENKDLIDNSGLSAY